MDAIAEVYASTFEESQNDNLNLTKQEEQPVFENTVIDSSHFDKTVKDYNTEIQSDTKIPQFIFIN